MTRNRNARQGGFPRSSSAQQRDVTICLPETHLNSTGYPTRGFPRSSSAEERVERMRVRRALMALAGTVIGRTPNTAMGRLNAYMNHALATGPEDAVERVFQTWLRDTETPESNVALLWDHLLTLGTPRWELLEADGAEGVGVCFIAEWTPFTEEQLRELRAQSPSLAKVTEWCSLGQPGLRMA